MRSVIDELLEHTRRSHDGRSRRLAAAPAMRLAIVTCMDSRIDLFRILGLRDGDAHLIRNAGGNVTDDVIRSLAISQRALGTSAVMLIRHTDCGMERIDDDAFHAELADDAGTAPPFAIGAFTDVDADTRAAIARIAGSPFLLHRDVVRGFVYDVATGGLREVTPG